MEYLIPKYDFEKVESKVKSLKKKIPDLTFKIIEDNILKCYYEQGALVHSVECVKVELSGAYIEGNFEFVGTIQHKDIGNIISLGVRQDINIPKIYYNCKPNCDHCNKIRSRKDTYLVYNIKTNEYKQVGKNCLKDYTGLDAETIGALYQVEDVLGKGDFIEEFETSNCYKSTFRLDTDLIKCISYDIINKSGYNKEFIRDMIVKELSETFKDELYILERHLVVLNDMNTYMKKMYEENKQNQYYHNCWVAWNTSTLDYRNINLVASFIFGYIKHKKETMDVSNEYVGNIGDKITFKVNSVRVLYCKGKYSYYSDYVNVLELKDEEGHTYKWSTSTIIKEEDVITAKVKEHKEYKGIKQTIITRGSVEKKEEKCEPSTSTNVIDGFKMWCDYLDDEKDSKELNVLNDTYNGDEELMNEHNELFKELYGEV